MCLFRSTDQLHNEQYHIKHMMKYDGCLFNTEKPVSFLRDSQSKKHAVAIYSRIITGAKEFKHVIVLCKCS